MLQKQESVENGVAEKMTAEIIAGTLTKDAIIDRKSVVDGESSDEERAN